MLVQYWMAEVSKKKISMLRFSSPLEFVYVLTVDEERELYTRWISQERFLVWIAFVKRINDILRISVK